MNENERVFVTIEISPAEANELIQLLKPIELTIDSNIVTTLVEMCKIVGNYPDFMDSFNSDMVYDDSNNFEDEVRMSDLFATWDDDMIQPFGVGQPQNWRYN